MVAHGRVLVLVFLLLSMQQEMRGHALQHDAIRLADTQQAWHATAAGSCPVCALLAGGAHVLGSPGTAGAAETVAVTTAGWEGRSATVAAPSHYSSRAPPHFL